jgi:hypothetical protein
MAFDFTKLIPTLQSKLSATRERLTSLREARHAHALKAATGDKKAKEVIAKVEEEVADVSTEAETLAIALEQAQKQQRELEIKASEDQRQKRISEAREIASELQSIATEADRLMTSLAQCLGRRGGVIKRLAETGVVYVRIINSLKRRSNVRSALWYAGLGEYVDLEFMVGPRRRPLARGDLTHTSLIGRSASAEAAL